MNSNDKLQSRKVAGENLRAYRKQRGVSAAELCDILAHDYKVAVKPQYLSKWELGQQGIPLPAAEALCSYFRVTLSDLYGTRTTRSSYSDDELDLIERYRRLTVNSKQIVSTLVDMELKHIRANEQGDKQITIFPTVTRTAKTENATRPKSENAEKKSRGEYLKVFDQPAAAGTGSYVDGDSYEQVRVSSIPLGTEFGVRIQGDSMLPEVSDGDIAFVQRRAQIDVGDIGIFTYNGDTFCKQLSYHGGKYYLHSLNPKYKDIPINSELECFYVIGKVIGSEKA